MKDMEWTFIDKTDWLDGPWKNEVDKKQWTDTRTGFPCLIRRNTFGVLCGYVAIGPEHPLFMKDYDSCAHLFDVHGGVTFSSFCAEDEDDPSAICHIVEPGDPDRVWWLGFHCANGFDYAPALTMSAAVAMLHSTRLESYRDFAYVTSECLSLARQLKEVGAWDAKILEGALRYDNE
jgi:hypothetical protein